MHRAARSSWTLDASSAPTVCAQASPARSVRPSTWPGHPVAPPTTPTTPAQSGTASSSSSRTGRSPVCSPPTTVRRASGCAPSRTGPRRSAVAPRRPPRPSTRCSPRPPPSSPPGCKGPAARRVRGALRLPNQVRQAFGPGWALVGDAGYPRDPITGHGISDAYRDAERLAVALDLALRGEIHDTAALAGYQRQRNEALREIFDITCALADYPPVDEFVALQKRLSQAIEVEAESMAARPVPGELQLAVA